MQRYWCDFECECATGWDGQLVKRMFLTIVPIILVLMEVHAKILVMTLNVNVPKGGMVILVKRMFLTIVPIIHV